MTEAAPSAELWPHRGSGWLRGSCRRAALTLCSGRSLPPASAPHVPCSVAPGPCREGLPECTLPPHTCRVRGASSPPCLLPQPLTPPLLPDSLSLLVVALDLPVTLLLLTFFKDRHLCVCTPSPLPSISCHPGSTHLLIADSVAGFQFSSFACTSVWGSWLLKWHSLLVFIAASSCSGRFLLLRLLWSSVLRPLFSSAVLPSVAC